MCPYCCGFQCHSNVLDVTSKSCWIIALGIVLIKISHSSNNTLSHGLNQTFEAQSDLRFKQWVALFIADRLSEIEVKLSADRLLQYRRVMDTRLAYWQGVEPDHDELKMVRELVEETIETIGFENLIKRNMAFIS